MSYVKLMRGDYPYLLIRQLKHSGSACPAGECQGQALNPKLFDFSVLNHRVLLPWEMLLCTLECLLEEKEGANILKK